MSGDIHARIRQEAEALRSGPPEAPHLAPELRPDHEMAKLLCAAMDVIASQFPDSFSFEGRTYWLRADSMLILDVFDSPSSKFPMLTTVAKGEKLGHGVRPK